MITNWYESESTEKPSELDTTSSRTTVYQRRNIRKVTREGTDNEPSQEVYVYDERTMSHADYAIELMNKNTADIDYIAMMSDIELDSGETDETEDENNEQ